MNLRAVSLVVVVVVVVALALQGCTKTVYHAVLAPHAAMDDSNGCFRRCQIFHAGQTKQLLKCVDTCPDSRTINDKRCEEVQYDDKAYGCVTAHNQTFDGLTFGLAMGLLALATVIVFALVASADNNGYPGAK